MQAGKKDGEVLTIQTSCSKCKHKVKIKNVPGWTDANKRTSGKRGPTIHPFNLEGVAATVLNGGTQASYERGYHDRGLGCLSKKGYRNAEKKILDAVKQVNEKDCEKTISTYQSNISETKLDLSGDNGWAHRRNASESVYVLVDLKEQKVIHQEVLVKKRTRQICGKEVVITEGNYFGTSKGMEGEGFRRCVNWLDQQKLLPVVKDFASDDDSSVQSTLRTDPRLQHIHVRLDPGHTKNNIIKDIRRALGESKAVQGFAERIGRWIMTALKKALLAVPQVYYYLKNKQ